MVKNFQTLKPQDIKDNCFQLIGDDWMLITAGDLDSYNTMTASWGSMGVLWNLPVAICFIRPHRYTFQFAEREHYFTLSFFDRKYRDVLRFCGSKSGREHDKALETGLNPIATELGNVTFEQARLILECKKIYADDLKEEKFLIKDLIFKNYPIKDFHRFYIGEVINVYQKI